MVIGVHDSVPHSVVFPYLPPWELLDKQGMPPADPKTLSKVLYAGCAVYMWIMELIKI